MTALAVGLLVTGAGPVAAQTIDTRSLGFEGRIRSFGAEPSGHTTFGQTFKALNTHLDSFEFRYAVANAADPVDFRFYVMGWNNATFRAEGPILFESATTTASTALPGAYYAFDTGGLSLTPGGTYVGFFSSRGLPDQPGTNAGTALARGLYNPDFGTEFPGVYADGQFVYWAASDFSQLTRREWFGSWKGYDLDFKAEFSDGSASAVPEPASLALMLPGLGAVALLKRRKKPAE